MATRKRALPVKTAGQQLVEELSAEGDPFSLRFLIEQAGQAADFLERLSALLNGDREAWLSVKIGAKTVEVVVNNVLVQHRQQADQLRKLLGRSTDGGATRLVTRMTTPPKGSRRSSPKSRWPNFVGTWPRLIGRQTPEIECRHPGDESEGDRCATFAFRIGLRCMPWQWLILRAMLSLLDPNQWGERLFTHRNVVIECSRQNGKTLIVIVRILWGLFRRRERILYTAQEWKTAEDVFDRVCAVIDRVPAFRRQLAAKPSKKDNRGVILLVDGTKADFGPRSLNFGRGLTEVDLLIMDEAYDVVPKHSANLTGTQRAAQNPQTIWLSTPPVAAEHPHCHKLAGFHRLGKAGARTRSGRCACITPCSRHRMAWRAPTRRRIRWRIRR